MKPEDKEEKPAAKKPAEGGKIFDVSRPGKAPASPTSKPVIVGHRPEAQQAQTAVSGIGESKPLVTRRKIQIMPSGDLKVADTEKPAGAAPESPKKEEAKPETPAPQEEQEAIGAAAIDAAGGAPEVPEDNKMLGKHLTIQPLADAETPKEEEPKTGEPEEEVPSLADEPGESEPKPGEESKTEEEPKAAEAETPAATEAAPDLTGEKTEEEKPGEDAPKSEDQPKTLAEELPEDSSSVPVETGGPDDKSAKPEGAEGEEPAPEEPEVKIEPLFDESGRIVVSQHNHHKRHSAKVVVLLLLIIVLAVVALDILLDLEILNLEGIPHTDFL